MHFNGLGNHDSQYIHLSGLITCNLVKQRRNGPDAENSKLHSYAYRYKVRVTRDNEKLEVPVCYKGFIAMHGITPRWLQTIQQQLTEFGKVLPDKRGKHLNRPHALSEEITSKIHEHIQSLRGRKAHYSLKKTDKIYLPDASLNIIKLHKMYQEKYPNFLVSYDTYRKIFETNYNSTF